MPPLTPVGWLAVVAVSTINKVVSAPLPALSLPTFMRLLLVSTVKILSLVERWILNAVAELEVFLNKAWPVLDTETTSVADLCSCSKLPVALVLSIYIEALLVASA